MYEHIHADCFVRSGENAFDGPIDFMTASGRVDAAQRIPLKVTAGTGRIALRWPNSTVVRRLIDEFEGPVTGTSANISGFPSCSNAEQVMKQLGLRVPLVLDTGETGGTLASTIVELNGDTWRIGREGAIPVADIAKALE